jgi:hypothetical protein
VVESVALQAKMDLSITEGDLQSMISTVTDIELAEQVCIVATNENNFCT